MNFTKRRNTDTWDLPPYMRTPHVHQPLRGNATTDTGRRPAGGTGSARHCSILPGAAMNFA
ncbi:hypothetical protein Slala02_23730 [Streptomyces lavendulae subsp. lavendulae]|nr:hypothetical protein Slala01_60460 [Streptomyces lavendulae subsp. lavendulae]GLX26553.1 hypothetical protein Slala02_23730 [Streptomyces lavendulae subsp. lavendulae]